MRRLLVVAAIAAAGCRPAEPKVQLPVSDSVYVHTMVALWKVATDSSIDSTARDSMRRQVLRDNRVTVQLLDSTSRLLAIQPVRANSLWARIDRQSARRNQATAVTP